MNFRKICLVTLFFLTGCTSLPGSYLSVSDKEQVSEKKEHSEYQLSEQVMVYPLSMSNVSQFKQEVVLSHANTELDNSRVDYQYFIGPGDILNIVVYDHPELTTPAGDYRSAADSGNWVRNDGTIFYPYIGKVKVAGKTVQQVRKEITKRLKTYIEKPQVEVTIAAFRSKRVYVTGEIKKPGVQYLTNIPLTLLDAVNSSGGLSENADWRHVTLTRLGNKEIISLHSLMQQGDLRENRLLQPGDIIHVPRNDDQKVFVMGEVHEQKTIKIDRAGMSLTEALSTAGGLDQLHADATGVFVIRMMPNTEADKIRAHIYQLDVQDASAFVIGTEFDLHSKDIVYVTAAPVARWNRAIAQILPTLTGVKLVGDVRGQYVK